MEFFSERTERALAEYARFIESCIDSVHRKLAQKVCGHASISMLNDIYVERNIGGQFLTELGSLASCDTKDARTIFVKPFQKKDMADVEKAIRDSNRGFSLNNDGETIRLTMPILTEEHRLELVKKVRDEIEQEKEHVKIMREDTGEQIRGSVSEDEFKEVERHLQVMQDDCIAWIERIFIDKEKDIMSV